MGLVTRASAEGRNCSRRSLSFNLLNIPLLLTGISILKTDSRKFYARWRKCKTNAIVSREKPGDSLPSLHDRVYARIHRLPANIHLAGAQNRLTSYGLT